MLDEEEDEWDDSHESDGVDYRAIRCHDDFLGDSIRGDENADVEFPT